MGPAVVSTPVRFQDARRLDVEHQRGTAAFGTLGVVPGGLGRLDLRVDRAPHRAEQRACRAGNDRARLICVQKFDLGEAGFVSFRDHALQDRSFILARLEVKVSAGHELEVALGGRLLPQLEGFHRQWEFGTVPTLDSQRTLRPARGLAGRFGFLLHEHGARAASSDRRGGRRSDDSTSDDDDISAGR